MCRQWRTCQPSARPKEAPHPLAASSKRPSPSNSVPFPSPIPPTHRWCQGRERATFLHRACPGIAEGPLRSPKLVSQKFRRLKLDRLFVTSWMMPPTCRRDEMKGRGQDRAPRKEGRDRMHYDARRGILNWFSRSATKRARDAIMEGLARFPLSPRFSSQSIKRAGTIPCGEADTETRPTSRPHA